MADPQNNRRKFTLQLKYAIRAQPRIDKLPLFWTILNDGRVEKQEPDGREILASMKRAVMVDGEVRWHETCYCTPPLQHERSTVYDQFFSHIQIEPLRDPSMLKGESFWDYLRNYSNMESNEPAEASVATHIKYVPIRIL
jgi:hypothetical protein